MAIEVGDAIFRFIGDTTNLDAAWVRVRNDSKNNLGPATTTVQAFGQSWKEMGTTSVIAADAGSAATAKLNDAVAKTNLQPVIVQAKEEGDQFAATGVQAEAAGQQIIAVGEEGASAGAAIGTGLAQVPPVVEIINTDLNTTIEAEKTAGTAGQAAGAQITTGGEEAAVALAAARGQAELLTAQLRTALATIQAQTPASQAEIEGLRARVLELEIEIEKLNTLIQQTGPRFKRAGEEAAFNMREAKATTALLGEEIGINVPRHIRGFLTSLPGVGVALSAAFEATAVLIIIQLLSEGIEKLTEWTADTFIFTAAQKALEAQIVSSNKKIADYNEKVRELRTEYSLIGSGGSLKAFQDSINKIDEGGETTARLNDIKNELYGVRNGMVTIPEAARIANGAIRELNKGLSEEELKKQKLLIPEDILAGEVPTDEAREKVIGALSAVHDELLAKQRQFQAQEINLAKEYDQSALKETLDAGEARVSIAQRLNDILTTVSLSGQLLDNSRKQVSYAEDAIAFKRASDEKYQTEVSAIAQERALLDQQKQAQLTDLEVSRALFAQDPKHNAAKIAAIDDEILAVDRQFSTREIELQGQQAEATLRYQQENLRVVSDFVKKRQELVLAAAKEDTPINEDSVRQSVVVYQQIFAAERQFLGEEFNAQRAAITQRIELLSSDPTHNVDALSSLFSKLEQLELEHSDRLLSITAEYILRRNALLVQPTIEKLPEAIKPSPEVTRFTNQLQELTDAYQTLRIQGTLPLVASLGDQEQALQTVERAEQQGTATARDVLQAKEAVLTTEIELAQARLENVRVLIREAEAGHENVDALKAEADQEQQNIDALRHQRGAVQDLQGGYGSFWSHTGIILSAYKKELDHSGSHSKAVWAGVSEAVGSAVKAYALGQATIGQALAGILQAELANLAQFATVHALKELALGFSTMFTNPPESASHFQAAALFGVLAIGAAVTSRALTGAAQGDNGATGGTGGGGTAAGGRPPAVEQPPQNPVQTQNVQSFATGGVSAGMISGPTLVMLGDHSKRQQGRELFLPLDDPDAVNAIVEALGGGGGDVHQHFHIKGIIDGSTFKRIARNMSREVDTGRATLKSTVATRVLPKS